MLFSRASKCAKVQLFCPNHKSLDFLAQVYPFSLSLSLSACLSVSLFLTGVDQDSNLMTIVLSLCKPPNGWVNAWMDASNEGATCLSHSVFSLLFVCF